MLKDLNGKWLLAIDKDNKGRDNGWFKAIDVPNAQEVEVPCTIQQNFPGYCGVAWYWRKFNLAESHYPDGRCLLRFWAVDYLADVWINGVYVGGHEGGEAPFILDITNAVKTGQENLIAVRILNPGNEPIDGIRLQISGIRFWR